MFQHNTYPNKFAYLRHLLFLIILISGLFLPTAESWAASAPSQQSKQLGPVAFNTLNSETAVDAKETITGLVVSKPLLGILGTWVI